MITSAAKCPPAATNGCWRPTGPPNERCSPPSTQRPARAGQAAYPVVREALVCQAAALAQARCVQECTSLGAQLRTELPTGAYAEVSADDDALCAGRSGFVCAWCGVRPSAATGAVCRICDPKALISYHRARQLLDNKAAEAGKASGRPAWKINVLISRALGGTGPNCAGTAPPFTVAAGPVVAHWWASRR